MIDFIRSCLIFGILCLYAGSIPAQEIKIHSHNDYRQDIPFYHAYDQRIASIEADIYATENKDELLVAHDLIELPEAPTIDDAYLLPLVNLFKRHNGRAWKDTDKLLILLIDIKTPVNPTLNCLINKLQQYPEVFDRTVNPFAVRVIISGNRPDPDSFGSYPAIISFDGSHTDYTPKQLERIDMISLNFRNFAKWNGNDKMKPDEFEQVQAAIDAVHALGKPIRFWGTPDGVTAWNTFHNIGVDYINTDKPEACAAFFRDLRQ